MMGETFAEGIPNDFIATLPSVRGTLESRERERRAPVQLPVGLGVAPMAPTEVPDQRTP